jgi:hypothetical protein
MYIEPTCALPAVGVEQERWSRGENPSLSSMIPALHTARARSSGRNRSKHKTSRRIDDAAIIGTCIASNARNPRKVPEVP